MPRRSKREIERRLEEIEPDVRDDYPVVDNLSVLLSQDWNTVDEEQNLYANEAGTVHYFDPEFIDTVADVVDEE